MRYALSSFITALLLLPVVGCAPKEQPAQRQIGFVTIITERLEPARVAVMEAPDPRELDKSEWKRCDSSFHPVGADGKLFRPPSNPPSVEELREGAWSFRYVWNAVDQTTAGDSFPRGVNGTFYLIDLADGRFALVEIGESGGVRVLDHGLPRCMFSGAAVTAWEIAGDRLETSLAPPLIDLSGGMGR